jgi:hypothetical protein
MMYNHLERSQPRRKRATRTRIGEAHTIVPIDRQIASGTRTPGKMACRRAVLSVVFFVTEGPEFLRRVVCRHSASLVRAGGHLFFPLANCDKSGAPFECEDYVQGLGHKYLLFSQYSGATVVAALRNSWRELHELN